MLSNNNQLIIPHCVMTLRRRKNYRVLKAVSEMDKVSGFACSIIYSLVEDTFMHQNNVLTKFCHMTPGVPLVMHQHVFCVSADTVEFVVKLVAFVVKLNAVLGRMGCR